MINREQKPESEETLRVQSTHNSEDFAAMPAFRLSKQKGEWYRPPLVSMVDLQTHAVTVTIHGQAKKLPVTAIKKTRNIEERSFP